MSQTTDRIRSRYSLFEQDEHQTLPQNRKTLEEVYDAQCVQETSTWTITVEYEALNFQRGALTVDPAEACQPFDAILCTLGFAGILPYVYGLQGCVVYLYIYFNHHFKESVAHVSDSMTEDAVVLGGNNNMNLSPQNVSVLYKPEIIAVPTTCMAEAIGDDLQAFTANAKKEGFVDDSIAILYAHTSSFIGSRVAGWDNVFEEFAKTSIADYAGRSGKQQKLNLVTGSKTYLGNFRVLKWMMAQVDVPCGLFSDSSEVLGTPVDGHCRMYAGGTSQREIKTAPDAIDTLLLQPWQLVKSKKVVQETWNQPTTEVAVPLGLVVTDALPMTVSQLTGKPIADALTLERDRPVDMMLDFHTWLHGKKFGLYGDPDFVMGLTRFLLELGREPTAILSHGANKHWQKAMEKMLNASPYGQKSEVFINCNLWHFRPLMFTRQPDFMVGNFYGKFIQRDTLVEGKTFEVLLTRLGFLLFDRHHLHRQTTWGYEGAMNIIMTLVNVVLGKLDYDTSQLGKTDYSFDLIR